MDRAEIKMIIREVIEELKRSGLMKMNDVNYAEISDILYEHYRGHKDSKLERILQDLRGDPYYEIIPDYFGRGWTLESIAELFGVEASTISRNKKRLCIEVYKRLEDPSK